MLPDYPRLIYRGHYRMTVGVDYSKALLSAQFGGGYRETETIFSPLLRANLSYPTLHRDAMIETEPDVFVDRLTYIWNFYTNSKDNADEPFLMKSPRNGLWYLWVFTDDDLTIELADLFMGSTGLKLEQVYVKGVEPDNADGSFNEE